jgi:uridine phosphorylase
MSITNKTQQLKGIRQYHILLSEGDVGKYVLLPGDPARSDMVAKYLDGAVLVGHNREHRSFSGTYKGIGVSVVSTGMGCPSCAIAAEELINIGAQCLIRIGSSAALDTRIRIGDLIVSTGAMKNEGTSRFYVPDVFPAVPDFELTGTLLGTAKRMADELDYDCYYGINATDDAFYGEDEEWIRRLAGYGITNIEMEASSLFTISRVRGVRSAMVCAASANLVTNEVVYGRENVKLAEGWDKEIRMVLEAIVAFEAEYQIQGDAPVPAFKEFRPSAPSIAG